MERNLATMELTNLRDSRFVANLFAERRDLSTAMHRATAAIALAEH
jgi:hypothetical protein